jgi:hypothetical protein
MARVIIGSRTYWLVDGIVFTSHQAAVEYRQSR